MPRRCGNTPGAPVKVIAERLGHENPATFELDDLLDGLETGVFEENSHGAEAEAELREVHR